jgi:hypothetical protein
VAWCWGTSVGPAGGNQDSGKGLCLAAVQRGAACTGAATETAQGQIRTKALVHGLTGEGWPAARRALRALRTRPSRWIPVLAGGWRQ